MIRFGEEARMEMVVKVKVSEEGGGPFLLLLVFPKEFSVLFN